MKKVISLVLALAMMLSLVSMATAEGSKVVYWTMWNSNEPQGQAIEQAVREWEAKTGNTVDLQFKGRDGIRQGLQPALDAGTVVDVFDEDIDRINVTFADYLMDLEDLAKANDYDATANAGLMAACRSYTGTLKTIPYQPFVFAFFYDADKFADAGIEAVPTNWTEFLDVCAKLKAKGYDPIACDDAYIDCMLGYHMARLVGEAGVTEIVKNGDWAESEAAVQAAKDYEELASLGYFSSTIASSAWPAAQQELVLGNAAMYLNGSWLMNEVRETAGDDFPWGCFSYPAVNNGTEGPEAANFGGQVLAINKKSEVSEAAFDLITYLTKGEADLNLANMSWGIPADTTNTEWPAAVACAQPVMSALTTRYSWAAGIESNADVTPIIISNFKQLCGGTLTADQFIANMEAAGK